MSEKDMLLSTMEREFPITVRILRAFPADKADFKPHERSRSAKELMWTMALEYRLIVNGALAGTVAFHQDPTPETLEEIISGYESIFKELVSKIKEMPDADMNANIKFAAGTPMEREMRRGDAFWLAVMDTVHHRGQMSVYIRMAGGKVPSIYGPSADDPGQ